MPTITETFSYTGDVQQWSVPAGVEEAWITIVGAGGEDGDDSADPGGLGGPGGRIEGLVDLTGASVVDLYVPGGNGNTWGWRDGGLGGSASGTNGGNGAGAGAAVINAIAALIGDGGGGGGGGANSFSNTNGGGGGGRGGAGGAGTGSGEDGDDAEGTGNGGAGGAGGGAGEGEPGGPGGTEYDSGQVSDVTATDGGGNDADGEIIVEYEVPPPENVTITDETETSLTVSWDGVDDADEYTVYGSDSSEDADPANYTELTTTSSTSYTDDELTNGVSRYYRVASVMSGEESALSEETTGTTILPTTEIDDWQAVSGTEIRLEWTKADDNSDGTFEVYRSESSGSLGSNVGSVSASTTEFVDDSVSNGPDYWHTIRRDTTDTTADSAQIETTTRVDAPVGVGTTAVEKTSVSLTWSEGTGVETRYVIERQRDWGEGYADREEIDTVDASTTSLEDNTVVPGTDYRFWIRAETDWDSGEDSIEVTTEELGIGRRRVGSSGWYTEVDHPTGNTLTPQILDGARLEPRLNALPEARIPVPRDESWFSESLESAPMRVFRDGWQRPVDELEDVVAHPDRNELVGVGGTQLERRVQEDVTAEPAHELADRLVGENTDYVTNVDAPVTEESTAVVQDPSTSEEFNENYSKKDADPTVVENDYVTTVKTCFTRVASDRDADNNPQFRTGRDAYVSGQAIGVGDDGAWVEWTDTVEHTIPADDVGVHLCFADTTDALESRVILDVDGTEHVLYSISANQGINTGTDDILWEDMANDPFGDSAGYDGPDIEAGSDVTLRIEAWSPTGTYTGVTAVTTVCDNRYNYTFDEQVHEAQGHLDGPQYYPDVASVVFDRYPTILAVYGGALESTWDDTSGDQYVAISNDGVDWVREDNSQTVSGEFESLTGEIVVDLGIGRYGSQSSTPRTGVNSQNVQMVELTAWLDDTPLILNRTFDDDLVNILSEIATTSDSLFEVRQDGASTTFEWAQPGQRSSTEGAPVANYEVTKHNKRVLKCTVIGGKSPVADEEIVAAHDAPVALEEGRIVPGSERVRDVETGEVYREAIDYELQPHDGELDIRPIGGIEDGQELLVDYDYKLADSYEHPDFDGDPRTSITEQIPEASSERACGRSAKVIVDENSEPRYEATVEIPTGEDVEQLLEALDLDEVPGGALSVYAGPEETDGQQLQLGSSDRVRDTVERIQSQLSATSKRV